MEQSSRPVFALCLLVVAAAVSPAGVVAAQEGESSPCVGTVAEPASGLTVVSVQGYVRAFERVDMAKLVAIGPRGEVRWTHRARGAESWFYDVDPMPNGDLFVTATLVNETTRLFVLDRTTGERTWVRTLPYADTHDADLIDGGEEILLGNMRNTTNNVSNDGVVVLDRATGEPVWSWRVRNHYPPDTAEGIASDDWTHLNDVEAIGGGVYLASLRNFDQVVAVERATGEVVMRLGRPGQRERLFHQHNPDYLESESGTPTLVVADSENDRVAEYARGEDGWERTWSVGGFEWPRDADRLPDGNTVLAVSGGHRVVEVDPSGDVVWSVAVPGSPYDVERIPTGDESRGPTMADRGVSGDRQLGSGPAVPSTERLRACNEVIEAAPSLSTFAAGAETPVETPVPARTDGYTPEEELTPLPGTPLPGTPTTPDRSVPWGLGLVAAALVAGLVVLVLVRRRT